MSTVRVRCLVRCTGLTGFQLVSVSGCDLRMCERLSQFYDQGVRKTKMMVRGPVLGPGLGPGWAQGSLSDILERFIVW